MASQQDWDVGVRGGGEWREREEGRSLSHRTDLPAVSGHLAGSPSSTQKFVVVMMTRIRHRLSVPQRRACTKTSNH